MQNKQDNMVENHCQRMKNFVLVNHVPSYLFLSKARSSVFFPSSACRTAMHLPELGSLELFSILGGNTKAKAKARNHGTKHPALQEFKASEQLQTKPFGLTQTKDCSSLWRRIERLRNTMILLLQQRTVPHFPKAHLGLLLPHAHLLSALCIRT